MYQFYNAMNNIKPIKLYGRIHNIMILPVLSLSRPDLNNEQRLIFDWGKSLSHPNANIAFAFMKRTYISALAYGSNMYTISVIKNCRSGRKAATVQCMGPISHGHRAVIDEFMSQEFPAIKI